MTEQAGRIRAVLVLGCLGASALILAAAPLALPGDYSWIAHTTSEAAAQGVNGAWVARAGFMLFGLAVVWIVQDGNSGLWQRGMFLVAYVWYGREAYLAFPLRRRSDRPA